MDDSDVQEKVEQFDVHEWNEIRFNVLSKLRQEGIKKAIELNTDFYFVCDVDNFLLPNTLVELVKINLPIVSPLLKYAFSEDDYRPGYSNFHHPVNKWGYFENSEIYFDILYQRIFESAPQRGASFKSVTGNLVEELSAERIEFFNGINRFEPGLHLVDLIHCTYLIKKNILHEISYFDDTKDYEYVIFSRNLRKQQFPQVLDTRKIYGCLTLTENLENCKKFMEKLSIEN